MTTLRDDATYYEVDAGDVIYVAKRTLTRRGDKQLKLTVNTPVRFAVKKDDFYLLDEDGKQHKLSIEKKTLKNPQMIGRQELIPGKCYRDFHRDYCSKLRSSLSNPEQSASPSNPC